jgi:hypothetical protein
MDAVERGYGPQGIFHGIPEEPVRYLTKRDRWLIDCYRLPTRCTIDGTYFPVLDDLNDNRILAPNELIADVDRAYFRHSLQNEVDEWFKRRGFDPDGPTISKHPFEAAFQAEFGQLLPEPAKPLESASAAPLKTKKLKTKKRAATKKPWAYKRNTTDDALVMEAIEDLESKKFANVNQAALALAPRAKGSEQASVRRLNRKIGKAYDVFRRANKQQTNNDAGRDVKTSQKVSKQIKTSQKR